MQATAAMAAEIAAIRGGNQSTRLTEERPPPPRVSPPSAPNSMQAPRSGTRLISRLPPPPPPRPQSAAHQPTRVNDTFLSAAQAYADMMQKRESRFHQPPSEPALGSLVGSKKFVAPAPRAGVVHTPAVGEKRSWAGAQLNTHAATTAQVGLGLNLSMLVNIHAWPYFHNKL